MSLIGRRAGLALAVLMALFWTLLRHRPGPGAAPAASSIPAVAPLQSPFPPVKARRRTRKKVIAQIAAPPPSVPRVRGARLKEKGEALGGRTPDRVDAGTMTAPSAQ